jgi:hypothetical protein
MATGNDLHEYLIACLETSAATRAAAAEQSRAQARDARGSADPAGVSPLRYRDAAEAERRLAARERHLADHEDQLADQGGRNTSAHRMAADLHREAAELHEWYARMDLLRTRTWPGGRGRIAR